MHEDSDLPVGKIDCPFCKNPMEKVYITMIGAARLFSSKEKLNWLTGGWTQKKEAILESGFDAEIPHSREGYKCNNCNAYLIEGKVGPNYVDARQATEAETEKENLKNRIRQLTGI